MCKLRVDKVIQGPKEVEVPGQDFKAFRFQCAGAVQEDRRLAPEERSFVFETTSTTIRDGVKPGLELEATRFKKPEGQVYSVKAGSNPHVKGKSRGGHRAEPVQKMSDRQQALKVAVELWRARSAEQGVPSDEEILATAEKFVSWLEGKIEDGGRRTEDGRGRS